MRPRKLILLAVVLWLPMVCKAQLPQALPLRAAGRIMDQATWGPEPIGLESLQSLGFDKWFAAQVAATVSTYPDQPLVDSLGNTNQNLVPVASVFFQNAVHGPDQLRQRVAFALSEIWVVSELETNNATAFPPLLRLFQNDAFGNYETLMKDVTLNPGMGHFLNMVNNQKANVAAGTAPNENYARETMQLFTLGLSKLNLDGTLALDTSGNPIPVYTPADVTNLSKVFTGWTYPPFPGFVTKTSNRTFYLLPMVPVESLHDMTQKTVLGVNLPPSQTAELDLAQALHVIFLHPNLPPFISHQLIQHLVTSNPSPAYVERVASVFENNGSGVRGDLKAVVYAILSDPEARAGDEAGLVDAPAFGHMREPVLLVANLLRGLNGSVTSTNLAANAATNLGQHLFYAPSVFNFFSPQYRAPGGLLAPEMQIYSTQTASLRAGTVNSAVYGGQFDAGSKVDLTAFIQSAADGNTALIAAINDRFLHQDMSANLKNAMNQALAPLTAPADKAKAALYVALTSAEYQVVH